MKVHFIRSFLAKTLDRSLKWFIWLHLYLHLEVSSNKWIEALILVTHDLNSIAICRPKYLYLYKRYAILLRQQFTLNQQFSHISNLYQYWRKKIRNMKIISACVLFVVIFASTKAEAEAEVCRSFMIMWELFL